MFEVSVTLEFSAAHRLPDYPGPCSNIHGHTWQVSISVIGQSLNQSGMIMDFRDLKDALSNVINSYDHQLINEIPPFDKTTPTAENIAREIYRQLRSGYPEINLSNVKVWESHSSCATYWED